MDPLVSVIVPVYKVEPYLRKCVDSIIGQTYRNLEIILVDDGSPDNCGCICDEYAEKDSRVKVIHKENGGLSDARNIGMQAMGGEYLAFVDSDDWLDPQAVERLVSAAEGSGADLVIGRCVRVKDGAERTARRPSGRGSAGELDAVSAMRQMFRGGCAAWARLYRCDIHAGIEFPIGEINEDEAVVLKVLDRCKKVTIIGETVYYYRCRPESITTSSFSAKKLVWQKHCADNLQFVQEHYPELVPDAAARYRGSLMWSLTEIALSDADYSDYIGELLAALRSNKRLFLSAPFEYPQDRIRLWMLTNLPFGVYRICMRLRRNRK